MRNLGNSHPISIQHRKFILFPGKCCPYSFIQKPDYELNKNFSKILGVAGTRINLPRHWFFCSFILTFLIRVPGTHIFWKQKVISIDLGEMWATLGTVELSGMLFGQIKLMCKISVCCQPVVWLWGHYLTSLSFPFLLYIMWYQTHTVLTEWLDRLNEMYSGDKQLELFQSYSINTAHFYKLFSFSLPLPSWSPFVFPAHRHPPSAQYKHQNKVTKNEFPSTWHSWLLRGPNVDFWGFIKHSLCSKSKEPATLWREESRRKKKKHSKNVF